MIFYYDLKLVMFISFKNLPGYPCAGLNTVPWDGFRLHTHQQNIAMHTVMRTRPPMMPPTMAPIRDAWDSSSVSKISVSTFCNLLFCIICKNDVIKHWSDEFLFNISHKVYNILAGIKLFLWPPNISCYNVIIQKSQQNFFFYLN